MSDDRRVPRALSASVTSLWVPSTWVLYPSGSCSNLKISMRMRRVCIWSFPHNFPNYRIKLLDCKKKCFRMIQTKSIHHVIQELLFLSKISMIKTRYIEFNILTNNISLGEMYYFLVYNFHVVKIYEPNIIKLMWRLYEYFTQMRDWGNINKDSVSCFPMALT